MTRDEKSWVMYDIGSSAFVLIILTTFLPIFFKDLAAAGLPQERANSWWSLTVSLSSVFLILISPILGTIADNRGFKKPLFVITVLFGIIFTAAFFFVGEGMWIFCLVLFILAKIGFNTSNVLYDSFLPDVCDEKRADWISSLGFGLGYGGSVIPLILCILLLKFHERLGLSVKTSLSFTFVITAVWWFFWTLPLIKKVKQKYFTTRTPRPFYNSFNRLIQTFREIKRYKIAFLFLVAYFLYFDGMNTVMIMCIPYAKDIGMSNETMMLVVLFSQIVSFPFSILFGFLAKKRSPLTMILAGILVYIVVIGSMTFLFINGTLSMTIKTIAVWFIAFLIATVNGGIQALSRSFFSTVIPVDKSAEFFGLYNITKYGAVLGPALIAAVTFLTGRNYMAMASISLLMLAGAAGLLFIKKEMRNGTVC